MAVGSVVPSDATVVDKLRKAEAIIIGKSNLSEFSQFRGTTWGWSARGGQTQSAYVTGGYRFPISIYVDFPLGEILVEVSGVGVSAGFAPVSE